MSPGAHSIYRAVCPLGRRMTNPRSLQRAARFHVSSKCQTDGVFQELTAMRVKMPYIEALKRREQGQDKEPEAAKQPFAAAMRSLAPKRMADSYHRVILPLARDPFLLDSYLNAAGHLRLGAIFMDLDALAGVVAYKHTGESVMTVTAAVDRITITNPLKEICDLELSGKVTFATGRSSMEITLQVAKAPKEGEEVKKEDVLMTCAFTMVSLDPVTKRPVNISPLKIETEEERRIFELGQENHKAKKDLAKSAILKQPPNAEESNLIHKIWQRQLAYHDPNVPLRKPSNTMDMSATKIHSTALMQPQYRNRHNFMIFGGFLLKQTFELAFCCAASFSHSRPTFVSLDPSTFENPVPVGSVLYLTATVAYTDVPLVPEDGEELWTSDTEDGGLSQPRSSGYTKVQDRVDSKVRDVGHGSTKPTGQFNYTFVIEKDVNVLPRTYQEFMVWVDARRRVQRVEASQSGVESGRDGQAFDEGKTERVTE